MADSNPWAADTWNLTLQGRYLQQNGRAMAEARARDAGTTFGAPRPKPPSAGKPPVYIFNKRTQVTNVTIGGGGGSGLVRWFAGAVPPPDALGSPGDFYLYTVTYDVYKKGNTTWSGESTATTWHSGDGIPADALGVAGDFYIDNSTGDVYQRGFTSWVESGVTTTWSAGTGVPLDSNGVDGDMYVDMSSGTVYQKSNGTWF